MSFIDTVRKFFAPQPAAIPPVLVRALPGGRTSQDTVNTFPAATWVIQPPPDYESNWYLYNLDSKALDRMNPADLMEMLADLSPEVSRALWDFLRMCNPGYEVKAYRPGSETEDARAAAAVDAFMDTLAERHGTFDILVSRLFMAPFLRGAFCAELVLDKRGRVPLDIATPDPASIRFRRRRDEVLGEVWQAGQWQGGKFIPLDIPTFRYLPVDPKPNTPYGRPLAAPALFVSVFLLGMMHDLKRVIQQQGYPRLDLEVGLTTLLEKMPHLAADSAALQAFAEDLIGQVNTAFSRLRPDDTYVHTDLVTVNRPVGAVDAGSLAAIDGVIMALERMAVRALKTNPLMFALGETSSETEANRQWEIYAAGIKSIQHYAENLLEYLFQLALEAQGIQADIVFRFAELRASEQLRDAQTEAMKIANATAKYEAGWYSQDEASEEVTGHKADQPEPRTVAIAAPEPVEGDNDGGEALNQGSDDRALRIHKRVKIIPDGADEPLTPVPETVTITDTDIERALAEWDALMPEYTGLLNATVVNGDQFDDDERFVQVRQFEESPWSYDQRSRRYRHTETGRFIGQRQMVELRDQFVAAKRDTGTNLAQQLGRGDITIQQWELEMRRNVKTAFVDEYVLGKGGRNAMTQSDWGTVGRMVKDQYSFAHQFARDIADGKLSQAQIEARSRLYFESATQAYERGRVASYGTPTLPAYPGDSSTRCRCITSPQSRVLTRDGWKAILDVKIGDYVLTHRLRWRKVLDVIVKPSQSYHRQIYIRAAGGKWVGATDNHLWYTDGEWLNSNDIDSQARMVYNYSCNVDPVSGEIGHEKILSEVRRLTVKSQQENSLSGVFVGLRVRESKGSSCDAVYILRDEQEGKSTMERQGREAEVVDCCSQGSQQETQNIRRPDMGDSLATQNGRTFLHLVLGRGSQENNLQIPVGLDTSQWPDSSRIPYSSQEREPGGRPSGEFGVDTAQQARSTARRFNSPEITRCNAVSDLPALRKDIQALGAQGQDNEVLLPGMLSRGETPLYLCDVRQEVLPIREENTEILFSDLLPEGTPLYDLTVEEDHSFVIEGLFAHNSNCKCNWSIEETETEWRCTWQLTPSAENCPDCQENARRWSPLVLSKSGRSRQQVERHLESLRNGHHPVLA